MLFLLLSAATALPPAFPIQEIERGQRGQCLTVFEGDTIEPFPFLVKGVMKNMLGPGQDVVLIRLEGDKAEFTGVVAGMSGSPCSIDGKLVGALAYSFARFAKEPIAGITPIGGMRDVMKLPAEKRPWRLSTTLDPDWQAFRDGRAPPAAEVGQAQPIATPLSLGSVPPAVRAHFLPYLRGLGFEPMAAAGGDGDTESASLAPGSAVAAVLVSGDVNIAGYGTVTSVEGKEVLAFGHPFVGSGAISFPMANATIINTMASELRSFKQATTGRLIGEFTQDRITAIGGRIGPVPAMVRVQGTVTTPAGRESFGLEVARDLELTPRFVAIGTAGALAGRIEASARGIMRMKGRIEVDGIEPVELEQVYGAERDSNLFVYAAIDLARAFVVLWDTPFGPPPQASVSLDVVYEPDPVYEWVEAIHVDRGRAVPGDDMEVAVRLRRNHGVTHLERFRMKVPRSWRGHTVELVAAGVNGAERLANQVEGHPVPTELADIGRWLSRRRVDGRLYLMAVRKGAGLRAGVEAMPFVPGSAVATFSGDPSKARRARGLAWEEYRVRPGVVAGEARITMKVARQ
jgi:hypothetical protein